ncbi:MAG: DUF885 domain-containing protein [bacterium]|nr:DUF885 domain-containing protein [bacterium]
MVIAEWTEAQAMRRWVLVFALSLAGASCTPSSPGTGEQLPSPTTTVVQSATTLKPVEIDTDSFRAIADGITRSLLAAQPELVTELGAGDLLELDVDYLLNDLSPRGQALLAEVASAGIEQLAAFDGYEDDSERLSADVLKWFLDDVVTMSTFAEYANPVNFITGAHTSFGEYMADVHPIADETDAENYVSRLLAYPGQIRDLTERLEDSSKSGIVPTDRSLDIARFQISAAVGSGDAETHPLVTDLIERVAAIPGENRSWAAGIGAKAEATVDDLILPALADLDDAVRRLDGRSDQTPGVAALAGGDAYYEAVLRHHLSIDMTPAQVHALGLAEVDRVVAELTERLSSMGYDTQNGFAGAVRTAAGDAGTMPTTSASERAAVLERTTNTVANASEVFEAMFTVSPVDELQVIRPRPGREGGSGAYYRPPPIDGSRSGAYYLSLGGSEFAVLTMDTTTYHEGIPGHHFQLSVQRSLEDVPLHQRVFDFTGYVEGWALYAERLAAEAGLYADDPLGDIGRLRMELLRAARMVTDTGIHWGGWSRNEAIEYMTDLGFATGMATAEVDRYIVWPGQAPAYMVGMLEILRLRDEAQAQLGDEFDLVGFHDAVLGEGSVPLALLETVIDQWVMTVDTVSS